MKKFKKFLAKALIFSLVLTSALGQNYMHVAHADDPAIPAITDENLDACIRDALGGEYMTPGYPISYGEAESLTELDCEDLSIAELDGLEYFTNLETLHLENNSITDLEPLSELTSLFFLFIDDNDITNIDPLINLVYLRDLHADNNLIGDISGLPVFSGPIQLDLSGNQITDITRFSDLSSSTITSLNLMNNLIEDISSLSSLPSLIYLYLSVNSISNINALSALPNLNFLSLVTNSVVDIQPLVDNDGISDGDSVELTGNPLSDDSVNTYIPALEDRGVAVAYVAEEEEEDGGGNKVEYNGSVGLSVVQDGDSYVATTEEEFNIIPSGDADIGDISFGYGVTLTADASWDGTLAASAGDVETPSALGFSEAKSIDVTKGDYEGTLQLSDESYVYITYDGFSDFTNPTVKIDRGDTTDTIERCSDVQWTGTSLDGDIIDSLHLEADTACYIGADDVDDEEEDFVVIGTRHLSEFIAGEGVAVNNGGSGGGVVIPREVITEVDDISAETATNAVNTSAETDTPAIDKITNQITETVEVVKTDAEVKAEEEKNIDKVENKVEDLFVTQNIDQSVLDSVSEIFAGNADADGDGISNAKELKNGTDPLINNKGTITEVFSKTENSSVGRLQVASVSSNGFILSGTTKANSEVSVKVGGNIFKTIADKNGHYLIPVELSNIEGLFAIETTVNREVSSMLVKAQKDTIAPPTINLEGKNISVFKDFRAEDLIEYLKGLENRWVRNTNITALTAIGSSEFKNRVIANIEVKSDSKNSNVIVKGTAVPGSTVILAYKSVIYSSVVIADKNGKFEAAVPKDLAAELALDKNLSEVSHQLIAFSVDYKTNEVSPFVRDLFKIYK